MQRLASKSNLDKVPVTGMARQTMAGQELVAMSAPVSRAGIKTQDEQSCIQKLDIMRKLRIPSSDITLSTADGKPLRHQNHGPPHATVPFH